MRHGFLGADLPEDIDASVQVASIQTLSALLRSGDPRASGYALLIPDEAHHKVSPTYRALFAANPDAPFLRPTATPLRVDGQGLGRGAGDVFDALVEGPTIAKSCKRTATSSGPGCSRPPGAAPTCAASALGSTTSRGNSSPNG